MKKEIKTIPIHDCATRHAGTDGTGGAAGKAHGMGIGALEDPMFTLTKGDQHSVAIAFDEVQITSKANRTKAEDGLPTSTISKGSRMMVAHPLCGGSRSAAVPALRRFPSVLTAARWALRCGLIRAIRATKEMVA